MKKYIIQGGKKLKGGLTVSGSKNIVSKALIAACLTDEEVTLKNIPLIKDFLIMLELFQEIGGEVELLDHSVRLRLRHVTSTKIPLEMGAKIKTSSMYLAPLLIRAKEALIPNPGGCRIGARPIDRHVKGLEAMGAQISYAREDGYFHAQTTGLHGTNYMFDKNTHTGTETLIIAAVCAKGQTVLENAAEEAEIDELVAFLNQMGADITRVEPRKIIINGVDELHGTTFTIAPDSNEIVTIAIASALTGGDITIRNGSLSMISAFLDKFKKAGGEWEESDKNIRFFCSGDIQPVDIQTAPHPGFKTDWMSLWAVFMTQAEGVSVIHETIYEKRFGFVAELHKMGAEIEMFQPQVDHPEKFYNFNYDVSKNNYRQAIRIHGKTPLHNAVMQISDLRAGATLIIASLIASGTSIIYGVDQVDRGYERLWERLRDVGADIQMIEEDEEVHLNRKEEHEISK